MSSPLWWHLAQSLLKYLFQWWNRYNRRRLKQCFIYKQCLYIIIVSLYICYVWSITKHIYVYVLSNFIYNITYILYITMIERKHGNYQNVNTSLYNENYNSWFSSLHFPIFKFSTVTITLKVRKCNFC